MAYINSIYNCGNDYPQYSTRTGRKPVPPKPPVPPEPPVPPVPRPYPEPQVKVALSVNGNILAIDATGDVEYVAGFIVDIFDENDTLQKSYTTTDTTFDLSVAQEELKPGTYTVKARAYGIDGKEFEESTGITWVCTVPLPDCEPMTLRFKFSKSDYAPVDPDTGTAVTTKGTWTKLDAGNDNIWDWTYDDPDWSAAFYNKFIDENNLVDVIDAGDTSSVTNCFRLFGSSSSNSNLQSCCLFNTSNVTQFSQMFLRCRILRDIPRFDTSSALEMEGFLNGCYELQSVPLFNTSLCKNFAIFFGSCKSITDIPLLDTSSATDMYGMFNTLPNITYIPKLDYSNVVSIERILGVGNPINAPQHMDSLPDISTVTNVLDNCKGAFQNIRNIKYGILDAYNILKACNPTSYTDCFLNCGIDTEEGRAQLEQIPESWGGLMPNNIIGITVNGEQTALAVNGAILKF